MPHVLLLLKADYLCNLDVCKLVAFNNQRSAEAMILLACAFLSPTFSKVFSRDFPY